MRENKIWQLKSKWKDSNMLSALGTVESFMSVEGRCQQEEIKERLRTGNTCKCQRQGCWARLRVCRRTRTPVSSLPLSQEATQVWPLSQHFHDHLFCHLLKFFWCCHRLLKFTLPQSVNSEPSVHSPVLTNTTWANAAQQTVLQRKENPKERYRVSLFLDSVVSILLNMVDSPLLVLSLLWSPAPRTRPALLHAWQSPLSCPP